MHHQKIELARIDRPSAPTAPKSCPVASVTWRTRRTVREDLDSTQGRVQMALLPAYSPDLNPVEYLWARLKRHALANFCPRSLAELKTTARNKLRSGQRRQSIITACGKQAELCDVMAYVKLNRRCRAVAERPLQAPTWP